LLTYRSMMVETKWSPGFGLGQRVSADSSAVKTAEPRLLSALRLYAALCTRRCG
jgi:hypothetical protein